jgi:hypothetical protein
MLMSSAPWWLLYLDHILNRSIPLQLTHYRVKSQNVVYLSENSCI